MNREGKTIIHIDLNNIELLQLPSSRLYNALTEVGLLRDTYHYYKQYKSGIFSALIKTPDDIILGYVSYTDRFQHLSSALIALEKLEKEDVTKLLISKKIVRLIDYQFLKFAEKFEEDLVRTLTDFNFLKKYFGEVDYVVFLVHWKTYCGDEDFFDRRINLLLNLGFRGTEVKSTQVFWKRRGESSES
ncbi:MAG: hypothetical protein DRN04_16380 [Thermoprotei archaeon]|nr:MAG: hypothetical protein DRN04_16380 [Thermoprotei archaeon]